MFNEVELSTLADTYVMPWAINLAIAIAILVVGRVAVKALSGV